ncbi:MAG: HlyD family secretion protein [Kofleriaceae bacterium]
MAEPSSNPEPSTKPVTREAAARKKSTRAYAVLGLLTTGIVGTYLIHGYATRDLVSTDDAQVEADVVPVAARVGGVVLEMHVQDNQAVKAGQLIAELDPVELRARLASAQAELDAALAQAEAAAAQVEIVKSTSRGGLSSARAQLEGTSASVRASASQVQAAAAAVSRAQSELAKAETDLGRAKKLAEAGAITRQQREAAQLDRDTATAALDQAKANLAAARDQQALSRSRVAEAQGRVEQSTPIDRQIAAASAAAKLADARVAAARAAVDLANIALANTKIVAPADGHVSRLAAHEGQSVQPGTMICMVVPRTTYVVANFKETQIARIRPGDEVEIEIDARPGSRTGKVVSVAAGTGARFSLMPPDNATGNFVKVVQRVPVKIAWELPSDGDSLEAGLSAEVTVHVQ